MIRYWTCQRVKGGKKCGYANAARYKLCAGCGKRRPTRRAPAHRAILAEMPYEAWVEAFGEVCGVCGRAPTARRRLDRDHCHATGEPRGLLCARCNRALPSWLDAQWLRKAAYYLEQHEGRLRARNAA